MNILSDGLGRYVNKSPTLFLICKKHTEEINPILFKNISDVIKMMAKDILQSLNNILYKLMQ